MRKARGVLLLHVFAVVSFCRSVIDVADFGAEYKKKISELCFNCYGGHNRDGFVTRLAML